MSLEKSNHSNTINRIKVVLLRTPMVVPKWTHANSICSPLGLAYVSASLQQAKYAIKSEESRLDMVFIQLINRLKRSKKNLQKL